MKKILSIKIWHLLLLLAVILVIVSVTYYVNTPKEITIPSDIIEENFVKRDVEQKLSTKTYEEKSFLTPNYDRKRKNEVLGVVLHHTAEPTVERSLFVLTTKKVGTHVVIDTDGTRYIMCEPEVATFHAGLSVLNGREGCNYFTIGIEFQGNTLEEPLTEDQIASGIEYLLPIIAKYKIPLENIVTHEMVRTAYKQKYPNKRCSGKVDITQTEYVRFMNALKKRVNLGGV
jgi:N-acetyl-anhydromuramyl-L-alanine amidase AmpD